MFASSAMEGLDDGPQRRRGAESAEDAEKRRIELDRISGAVIDAAVEVHREIGPGLLESSYETALGFELAERGIAVARQHRIPLRYKGRPLGKEMVLDLLVENLVIAEVKSVRAIEPVHEAQLLSYLRLSSLRVGLSLNFNMGTMRRGVRRMVNDY